MSKFLTVAAGEERRERSWRGPNFEEFLTMFTLRQVRIQGSQWVLCFFIFMMSGLAHGTVEMSRLTITPVSDSAILVLRDESGRIIGRVSGPTLFELDMKESDIAAATDPRGINADKLWSAVKTRATAKAGDLVQLSSPLEIISNENVRIYPGRTVFIALKTLKDLTKVQPAGAAGGASSKAFNETLSKQGVQGAKPPRTMKSGGRVHRGQKNVGLTEKNKVDPSGEKFLTSPTCDCPDRNCKISSYFGHRKAPKTKTGYGSSFHKGIDIPGRHGMPIRAAADGCVNRKIANRSSSAGFTLFLEHRNGDGSKNGYVTQYSHLSGFAADADIPTCFKRGEVIGQMGMTGNCSGPHLHFGLWRAGVPLDPRQYLENPTHMGVNGTCPAVEPGPRFLTSGEGQPAFKQPSTPVN